jgi:L-asparaginase
MRRAQEDNAASPLSNVAAAELAEVIQSFGQSEGISWELSGLLDPQGEAVEPVDSSAVGPCHWLWIAQHLERRYHEFDGFVVVHGTDTMAYTASALSFLLVNLAKPVVLTGSQLPIFSLRSDARQNLLHALLVAGGKAIGLPRVPEVVICFGEHLLRGNRARKASTTGWQGFASPNYPPLGVLGESLRIYPELLAPPPAAEAAFYVHRELETRVLDLTLFPGLRAGHLRALLQQEELRGLVLRAYGAGNAPEDEDLLECLGEAASAGKTILVVTQCQEGRVDLGRYASSRGLLLGGVCSGFDLTPEAALTKLMWVLANERGDEVRVQLQLDQRGEQSFARHEIRFALQSTGPQLNWELSARAGSAVKRSSLERAVLHFESSAPVAATLQGHPLLSQAPSGSYDVTDEVRRYMVDDRPFHLDLVGEQPVDLQRVELLLTTSA